MSIRARLQQPGPYVFGGSMAVLEQFISVAELIQAPSAMPAIELTFGIIEIVQTMKGTEGTCQRLMAQLGKLMLVVLRRWENKTEESVPTDLRESLSELQKSLENITMILEQIKNAPRWKIILRSQDRITKLGECQQLMDQAMALFQVDALIEGALQSDTDRATDVIVESGPNTQAVTSTTPVLQYHPAASLRGLETLFGREGYLEDLVERLCYDEKTGEENQPTSSPPRLAILGPGGIGKTAVALTATSNHRVTDMYQDRIYWVSCEEATSPELLVELIGQSMGVLKGERAHRKDDIINFLRSTTHPHLLVLDNFEIPWDTPMQQPEIDDIIFDIASASSITVLLTMRSDVPPSTRIQWTMPALPQLPALSLPAARELYLDIHKGSGSDTNLDPLLHELAYVPLAVRLMASRGSLGEMPSALLASWKDEGVRAELLHQGDDRITSVMVSVELSINSNLMRRNPEALVLLGVLAELPAGARRESLPDIAPTVVDPYSALATLRQAALIKIHPSSQYIQLLPTIRSVVREKYRAPPGLRALLLQAYIELVREYKSEPSHAIFPEAKRVLGLEAKNIKYILLDAVAKEPSDACIDAAYNYAAFQLVTSPRADVIESAVRAARGLSANHGLLSRGLVLAGEMYCTLGRYDDAIQTGKEALEIYKMTGDRPQGEAASLQCLGRVFRVLGRHSDVMEVWSQARVVYQRMGNQLGEANSLYSIGEANRAGDCYNDAVDAWRSALAIYQQLGSQLGEANTLRCLGEVYRMLGRYEDGMDLGQQSLAAHRRIGGQLGEAAALNDLAEICRMLGQYEEAIDQGEQALLLYKRIGDELGQANSLQCLGNVYLKLGRYEKAVEAETQALRLYERTSSQLGVANTLQSLGQSRRMLGQYDEAVGIVKQALAVYQRIGSQLGEGASLNDLLEIYQTLGRYEDAVEAGEQAIVVYRQIPSELGQAAILANLGLTYQSQGRHEEAAQFTRGACVIFQRMQRAGDAERCRALLKKWGVNPVPPSTAPQQEITPEAPEGTLQFVDEDFGTTTLHVSRGFPPKDSAPAPDPVTPPGTHVRPRTPVYRPITPGLPSNSQEEQPTQLQHPEHSSIPSPMPLQDSEHPIELDYIYVNKIKNHFASDPDTYHQFLNILRAYKEEQLPISNVYEQVTVLFDGSKELVDEFKQFLPDNSPPITTVPGAPIGRLANSSRPRKKATKNRRGAQGRSSRKR